MPRPTRGRAGRYLRLVRQTLAVIRLFNALTKLKIVKMKRGGQLFTVSGSRYHDTILVEETSVSSHVTKNLPNGQTAHLSRTEIDRGTHDEIVHRVAGREVRLPDRTRVYVIDWRIVPRLVLILLKMNSERRAAIEKEFSDRQLGAAQDALIGMADGKTFGDVILTKTSLRRARARGIRYCVLDYEGDKHIAGIKGEMVLIIEAMSQSELEIMGMIVNFNELCRHIVADEPDILDTDWDILNELGRQLNR